MRDTLFLLKERFSDGEGDNYFCPHCAEITGVLTYFPDLKDRLDIHTVDFKRPRAEIVELLDADHQGCPVLILAGSPPEEAAHLVSGQIKGRFYISGPREIARYWSQVYGTARPH